MRSSEILQVAERVTLMTCTLLNDLGQCWLRVLVPEVVPPKVRAFLIADFLAIVEVKVSVFRSSHPFHVYTAVEETLCDPNDQERNLFVVWNGRNNAKALWTDYVQVGKAASNGQS